MWLHRSRPRRLHPLCLQLLSVLFRLRAEAVPRHRAAAAPPPATGETSALRDLALLRAFRRTGCFDAALQAIREQGLDDSDAPWSLARVQARHEFVRSCVRTAAGLVRAIGGVHGLSELAALCM